MTIGVLVTLLAAARTDLLVFARVLTVAELLACIAPQWVRYVKLNSMPHVNSCYMFWGGWSCECEYERIGWLGDTVFLFGDVFDSNDSLRRECLKDFFLIAVTEFATANDTSARVERLVW